MLDTSPAAGDARFSFDADGSKWPAFPNKFNRGTFGYDRPGDSQSFSDPLMRAAEVENQPSFALYDPTVPVALPPNPLQEAFDQLSQIYARAGLDALSRFNGQGAGTSSTVLPADELSPSLGDALDPQYIVPQQAELRTNVGPAESSRGLGIDPFLDKPPDRGVTADGFTTDDYPNDSSGDPAVAIRRPAEDVVYSTAYSDLEPLSGLTRIKGGVDGNSFKYVGTQGLGLGPRTVGGAYGDPAAAPEVGGAFDPRFIVQTGAPPYRPPGPGHNGGPPLGKNSPSQIPTQPAGCTADDRQLTCGRWSRRSGGCNQLGAAARSTCTKRARGRRQARSLADDSSRPRGASSWWPVSWAGWPQYGGRRYVFIQDYRSLRQGEAICRHGDTSGTGTEESLNLPIESSLPFRTRFGTPNGAAVSGP